MQTNKRFRDDHWAILGFGLVAILAGLSHGINMFHFPYYENDEGVYLSQAWSLLYYGKLAPYTYWYDHAPAGWIFIAFWLLISGGLYTFGFSLNSGRVFMLVLQVLSTFLLMLITRRLTKSNTAAMLAGVIFALDPIGLYFHRRVLLDNIMIFWTLLSYALLVKDRLKMHDVLLSAVFFGFAVLTKENAVFFIPGFLGTIALLAHTHHKKLALVKWFFVMGCVVSLYFLYALLKREFFPSGSFLGGPSEHVSLLQTLKYQSSRDGGSILDLQGSTFWKHFFLWWKQDPFIMGAGVFASVATFLIALFKSKRAYLGPALLCAGFWLFLIRGGIVIEFYIVPLLPFMSLAIALTLHALWNFASHPLPQGARSGLFLALLLGLTAWMGIFSQESRAFSQNSPKVLRTYESSQTPAQLEAIDWIRSHVAKDSTVIIDNYAYLELRDPINPSGSLFSHAEWYWKVDQDREVREALLGNDPRNIDVVAVTPQMSGDLKQGMSPLTSEVLKHSRIWETFESDGWGVQFWRSYYPQAIMDRSWESYKKNFITNGQVLDPHQNITTSEGQSYALLRAVWQNDRTTFDEVLSWTNDNLRTNSELFAWKYGPSEQGLSKILDPMPAPDADQDIALALLFASARWDEQSYTDQALKIINAIWNEETKEMNGKRYLLASPAVAKEPNIVANPSYLSPFAYRIFQEVDPDHNWSSLVDTSYEVLNACSDSTLGADHREFLPPEWCTIAVDGKAEPTKVTNLEATGYSYNAFRVPWKVALDSLWYNEPRAKTYLENMTFIRDTWRKNKKLSVSYQHDGRVWEDYESVAGYATNLAILSMIEPGVADEMYDQKIYPKFYEDEKQSYWEDPQNYYTQNWAWFGTALHARLLPNLWAEYND